MRVNGFIKNFSRTKAGRDNAPPLHILIIQTNLVTRIRLWNRKTSSTGIIPGESLGISSPGCSAPTHLRHGRRGWEASSRASSAREAPGLTSSIFSGAYRRRCHLSGGGGWGGGSRATSHLPPDPSREAGARAHGGRGGSRWPGAGGPPLPARGPPRREAEEDTRRPRKLCPSPQGSSPRTCSPVCPIPARGVGRGGGTRGEGCGGGAPGKKRGCSEGSAPPPTGAARRRSGRYRRQGAATWRSERRRRGFTTTAAPVAAARASAPGGGRGTVRGEARQHPRGGPDPVTASCRAR